MILGLAQAAALAEHSLRRRLTTFFAWIGAVALIFGFQFALELEGADLWQLAPIVFWVLVPFVISLIPNNGDPALVRQQAEAVISDRLCLFALSSAMAVGGVLLIITRLALLALISIALGIDLVGQLAGFLDTANPSLFALFGSAYMLLGAASAAYVHSPQFLLDRKNMLDRPRILKLIPPQGRSQQTLWTPLNRCRSR